MNNTAVRKELKTQLKFHKKEVKKIQAAMKLFGIKKAKKKDKKGAAKKTE